VGDQLEFSVCKNENEDFFFEMGKEYERDGGFYIVPCQVDVVDLGQYVFRVSQMAEDEG
jgi:hypothetical protein